jgi:hypothetical protein
MAWQRLADRLSNLPYVLAGPVLRKVAPRSVSVWLATRVGGDVTLTVVDALNAPAPLASGRRHTVAVGAQLHIVCVTAVPAEGAADLVEGVIYRYNLAFTFDDQQNVEMDLPTATGTTPASGAFSYESSGLPSFCLPPASLDDLRLLCGSCRIPHGNGRDALPVADKLIAQASDNPLARPHQLLLTGDQIYADDVAASLLMVLSDASHTLLGWKEEVPIDEQGGSASVDDLLPFLRRQPLEDAGFTSEDLDGHLMSLGEYLCMYLMVWSNVLWPPEMPTFADATKAAEVFFDGDRDELDSWHQERSKKNHREDMDKQALQLLPLFRQDLKDVRRLLANIPSYMILDDHEVTDDWNMTRDICKALYGHRLGLRVVQNALVAYALCQHWGNVPEAFEDAGAGVATPPGKALLDLLDGTTDAGRYEASSPALRTLVGVHDEATLATRPDNAVFHDEGSLLYHFTVEGLGHQIIFTDTRTWRSFPTGRAGGGVLLPPEQLAQQIVATPTIEATPTTGERFLIVVLTTNAPAVEAIRSATRHDFIANSFEHYPDVYEAWELPSIHFDRLMVSLSDKLPVVDGRRTGALALLSGDVHFSFATRLLYKASTRVEDTQQPQPVKAVIAQVVASSLRKETDRTLGFHRDGYDYVPDWYYWLLVRRTRTQGYVGWSNSLGSKKAVGQHGLVVGGTFVPLYTARLDQPTLQTTDVELVWRFGGLSFGTAIDPQTPPDYSYRLDYLVPPEVTVPADTDPIPPLPPGATPDQRKMAAASLQLAATKYRMYNAGGGVNKVIGTNNLCEISFDWHPTNVSLRRLHHTVRWRKDRDSPVQLTEYVVSLDPDDPAFAELVPRAVQ